MEKDSEHSYFARLLGNQTRQRSDTFVGTPFYVAPEMLKKNKSGLYSDLWALGCILYEICSGRKMFMGKIN
jgi:NIMA (never in mitosis gene a)-related kinase 2